MAAGVGSYPEDLTRQQVNSKHLTYTANSMQSPITSLHHEPADTS